MTAAPAAAGAGRGGATTCGVVGGGGTEAAPTGISPKSMRLTEVPRATVT